MRDGLLGQPHGLEGFGTLQGRTFKNEAGQAEMMNLLRRVSVQPVP